MMQSCTLVYETATWDSGLDGDLLIKIYQKDEEAFDDDEIIMGKIRRVLASAYKGETNNEKLLQLSTIPEDTTHVLLAYDQENDERLVGCLTLRTIILNPKQKEEGFFFYLEMDKVAVMADVKGMGVDAAMYKAVKDLIKTMDPQMHNGKKVSLRSSVAINTGDDDFEMNKKFMQKQGFVFLGFEMSENDDDDATWTSKRVYGWNM